MSSRSPAARALLAGKRPAAAAPLWSKADALERRVRLAWGALFFNVLSYSDLPTIVHIPSKIGKLGTQGSLVVAVVLVLTANRKALVRPNAFLGIFSVLAISSVMMSVRFVSLGTDFRAARLVTFVAVLWLLTPWWGSDRLVLLRSQLLALTVTIGSVALGAVVAHGKAFSFDDRLSGAIWPMPPTQVAHYAAEAAGLTLLMWGCGLASRRRVAVIVPLCLVVLLLSHTRTAMLAMGIGLLVGGLSLVTTRRRVRRAFTATLICLAVLGPLAAPVITSYLERGQSSQQLTELTGRTKTWAGLLAQPRPESEKIFGSGLSNDSFDGLPIDDSWLAVYQGQGLVGDVLVGAMVLLLVLTAALAPPGPPRALALFIIAYCLVASFTETGLGDASTYSIDLTVAASLLAAGRRPRRAIAGAFT